MNTTKKYTIKWNKEVMTIDATLLSKVLDLKNEIAKLTNVEPTEQKLIFKSKILQDSGELFGIPDKATISMMGTANQNKMVIDSKITFLEDLTQEEKLRLLREKGEEIVFGLQNLGNTCYLNSTFQCLGRVPELRSALKELIKKPGNQQDMALALAKSMGITYHALDTAVDTVVPEQLVAVLRTLNPMFAENEKGYFKQQDADECWSLLMNSIKTYLPNNTKEEKYSNNLIDELFGVELQIQLKNVEIPEEVKTNKELVYKITCYIDSQTIELVDGLKKSLKENIDLYSDLLQRNTIFEKSQTINRLPQYLNIQFMRFFWKQENVSTGAKAGKAKILKSVMFSKIIDAYEMCTNETKELLNVGRKIESKMLKDDTKFRIDQVVKKEGDQMIPTGRYQLIAVVTHQGRSSDAGHYIGWVHKKDDKWLKYDDDVVSMVTTSDILELKGGGDWHMAYYCIYKMLEVPFMEIKE